MSHLITYLVCPLYAAKNSCEGMKENRTGSKLQVGNLSRRPCEEGSTRTTKQTMPTPDTFRYLSEPPHVESQCIFCKIADGRMKPGNRNDPSELILENEEVVVFHDINPGAQQHFLVIPKRHLKNCWSLDQGLLHEMDSVANKILQLYKPHGEPSRKFFIRPPWNSVYHVHLHVMIGELTDSFCDLRKIGFQSPWFHITPTQLSKEMGWGMVRDESL